MTTLDLRDIQGNIVKPYRYRFGCFLFVTIGGTEPTAEPSVAPDARTVAGSAAEGRRWLRDHLLDHVTDGTGAARRPQATNVAVTAAGLRALGVHPSILAGMPPAFVEGMAARRALLGDPAWVPRWWSAGTDHGDRAAPTGPASAGPPVAEGAGEPFEPHLLVQLYGTEASSVDDRRARLEASMAGYRDVACLGATPVHRVRDGSDRIENREHFGFVDGIGQPRIAELDADTVRLGARARRRHGFVEVGEFVLGYRDEGEEHPALPEPAELFRNGSYLAYRAYQQHVRAFQCHVEAQAAATSSTAEEVEGRMVGRYRDGTPLASARRPPRHGPPVKAADDFAYGDDPLGQRCPIGSHVRRANPRDALGFRAQLVERHRMMRRSMLVGPTVDDPDVDAFRGLAFMAYCADLTRQFEFVQCQWLNDGDGLGIGHRADDLVGVRPGAEDDERLVTPLGGLYGFVPGLRALAALSVDRFGAGWSRPRT